MIELDVLHLHPHAFETFVEDLFKIIKQVGEGSDRLLRETV